MCATDKRAAPHRRRPAPLSKIVSKYIEACIYSRAGATKFSHHMKFKLTHTVAEMMPRKRDGTNTCACRPRGHLVRLGEHERLRLGEGLGVGFGRIVA